MTWPAYDQPVPPYGWAPPPPPPRRRRGPVLAAVAAVVVLAVILGVVLYANRPGTNNSTAESAAHAPSSEPTPAAADPSTTETPGPVEATVPRQALPAILLDAGELATAVGVPAMFGSSSGNGTFGATATEPQSCGGAALPALRQVYSGSGYLAMPYRDFKDRPDQQFDNLVTQAVASFPSAAAARALVAAETGRWQSCASTVMALTIEGSPPDRLTVGQARVTDGTVSVSLVYEGLNGWGCQHVLTSRHNVVVDVRAWSYAGGGSAAQISDRIVARVTPA